MIIECIRQYVGDSLRSSIAAKAQIRKDISCMCKMAESGRDVPNSVFETLEEWNTVLQQEDFPELRQKPKAPRGPRP